MIFFFRFSYFGAGFCNISHCTYSKTATIRLDQTRSFWFLVFNLGSMSYKKKCWKRAFRRVGSKKRPENVPRTLFFCWFLAEILEFIVFHAIHLKKCHPMTASSLYIYIYICQRPHLVGTFLGFTMSKGRGREEKPRQKKAERRKKKNLETWKTPTFLWGFFLANFHYKTGEKLRFLTKMCPPVGVSPYIYMAKARQCAHILDFGRRAFSWQDG